MKKIYTYIIFAVCAIALTGCSERIEEGDFQPKVPHTFTAVIDDNDQTKTTLGDYPEDGSTTSRKVLWVPQDSLAVSSASWYHTDLFINKNLYISDTAIFEGSTSEASKYFALYPYSSNIDYYNYGDGQEFRFILPINQKYSQNNFSNKSFPMVGRKVEGENTFSFKNLCGALVVQLVGSETIKSITFSGKDASGNPIMVSGWAKVNLGYTDLPALEMYAANDDMRPTYNAVTLQCEDGVALDPSTPTPFYIVLPPGTYSSFELMISTESGKMMLKESNTPLTINRSRSAKAAALTYTETIPVNLSERGTSNSYIISESGLYSFDASIIGNGEAGIIPDAGFHTNNPDIEPASVELLWEDHSGVISGLAYNSDEKRISFMTHGAEGNALIAAKDEAGTIIWSWHIWCTDTPAEQTYINAQGQRFQVLDRNLGAIRADRGAGEEWKDAVGLHYQWGRKDPFTYRTSLPKIGYQLTIQESIEFADRLCNQYQWMANSNNRMWSDSTKTIYDPCPVGYKVAPNVIWSGFINANGSTSSQRENELNKVGSFNKGWDFIYDGVNTTYYPSSEQGGYWDINYSPSETDGRYWSSTSPWSDNGYNLYFTYTDEYNLNFNYAANDGSGYAWSVRCVSDEDYVDPTLPTIASVSVSSITQNDALAKCNITNSGSGDVTSRGVVWSTKPNPTVDLSTKSDNGSGTGEFTAVLSGLSEFTRYYLRGYATNSYGTAYSNEISFTTHYGGTTQNLSSAETANSYIVTGENIYKFKAVKGNSNESVGEVATAEVLWESFGTNESISPKDLINGVVYQNESIIFSSTSRKGNALIAAKDKDGNILWSWHIWLTDTPAEHSYSNGAATLMDRNLGATSATPGEVQALGLLYQWGRKDPFLGSSSTTESIVATSTIVWPETQYYATHGSIEYVTSHPTTFIRVLNNNEDYDWLYVHDTTLWGEEKTKYDPCPAGWKVASMKNESNPWSNDNFLTLPSRDDTNHGFLITLLSGEQAWYPLTGDRYFDGTINGVNSNNITWSSRSNETYGCSLGIWENGAINPHGHWVWKAVACAVRCQKITE